MKSKFEEVLATISAAVCFDELCFDRNQFKLLKGNWGELADIVLWFGSLSLLIQIKELSRRHPNADVLGLGEEPQCFFATLASDAAVLHPAERYA